jgi:hypothetical protein
MLLWGGRAVHSVERINDASEADERVLDHLAQLGCDPGVPREVTHYLYVREECAAAVVAGILERDGWHTTVEPCEDTSFLVHATRVGTLSTAIVKTTRSTLEAIAAEHDGVYDGWEARTG